MGDSGMQFSFSQTYADASHAVKERFGPLVGVLAIFLVLQIAVTGLMVVTSGTSFLTGAALMSGEPQASMGIGFWLLYAVQIFVSMAGMAALCIMASLLRTASIGDAIGDGFRSALTLLAALLVVIVGAGIIGLVLSLAIGGSIMASQSGGFVFLGMLVLFGLFAWLFTKLSLTLPIIAVDGERNPLAAMARSWSLTSGHALKIFFVWFVFWVALFAVFMVIGFALAGTMASVMGGGGAPGVGTFVILGLVYLAVVVAINLYLSALVAAVHAQLAGPNAAGYTETFA